MIILIIIILSAFLSYLGIDNSNNILLAIGTSLIASSIIYSLDILKQYGILTVGKKDTNKNISNTGIVNIYNKRSLDKYDILMENVNKKIDILGDSLRRFLETSKKFIDQYEKNKIKIKIRIILIDPDSAYSKEREKIEKDEEGTYKNSIKKLYDSLSSHSCVEIRKISTQLSTMVYRIDDIMFIGPYLYQTSSTVTITYEVEKHGWVVFKLYEDEFDKMWNNAKEYDQ